MNIVLWVLQGVLALFFTMGAVQQLFNFDTISKQYVIYRVLPRAFWAVYGSVTLLCALGLLLSPVWALATPIAASVLVVQGAVFAGLYAYHSGFRPSFLMWALWTVTPVILAAVIAYARFPATA